MAHTAACRATRSKASFEPNCNSWLELPSALACTVQPAVPIGSTPTLDRMALPLAVALHGSTARCSRLASSVATEGQGRRCGFLGLPRTATLGSVVGMQAFPMRALRPNVGRGPVARSAQAVMGRPPSGRARPTRPNPSLDPNRSSWLRQPPRSGQLQR